MIQDHDVVREGLAAFTDENAADNQLLPSLAAHGVKVTRSGEKAFLSLTGGRAIGSVHLTKAKGTH